MGSFYSVVVILQALVFASGETDLGVFSSRRTYKNACGSDGITCVSILANGFTFDVALAGKGEAGSVMMLPGHPESKDMFAPLMVKLASKGFRCVAVDQRGYSPGARPQQKEAYNYNELVLDIFAIADAVGFTQFHMVAHDQGARVSWHSIAVSQGAKRFLTFSTLSIPHADAFSDAVMGEHAVLQQQISSQYVTTFALSGSACLHDEYWFKHVKPHGLSSCSEYQKALWWYNGATDSGNMAQAPVISVDFLQKQRAAISAANSSGLTVEWLDMMIKTREVFGMESAYPAEGTPQKVRVGNVTVPILYVCGLSDHSDLCGLPGFKKSADFCLSGYRYLEVDCGHNVLACDNSDETEKVEDAILNFILQSFSLIV
jgi:pimeloyl-ACP methyl ester carboxylesterase